MNSNRTSEAVDQMSDVARCFNGQFHGVHLPNEDAIAIAEKYKRMEEALQARVKHAEECGGVILLVETGALAFDPLTPPL